MIIMRLLDSFHFFLFIVQVEMVLFMSIFLRWRLHDVDALTAILYVDVSAPSSLSGEKERGRARLRTSEKKRVVFAVYLGKILKG